jgi:hypothetical protein
MPRGQGPTSGIAGVVAWSDTSAWCVERGSGAFMHMSGHQGLTLRQPSFKVVQAGRRRQPALMRRARGMT